MQRIVLGMMALAIVFASTSAVCAGWVWRDGRWVYEDTQPPPEPKAPSAPARPAPRESAPATPAPKPPAPASPAAPAPGAVEAPRAKPPADAATGTPSELPDSMKPDRPKEEKPWYERAKWWQKPPPAGNDRPLFDQARADYAAGNKRTAEKRFKGLIKDYPESPCREESMWLRAESLFSRERYYEAYEQYEDLIEQYAGSARYQDAMNREVEIAELYFGPVRRRVLGIPLMSGESEAVEILRRVYEHQPTGELADDVVLRIADHHWSKNRWIDAEEYYDKYCREYPNGDAIRHAELRRAICGIRQCEGPRYCTTTLRLAGDRLRQFHAKYPEEAARNDVPAMIEQLTDTQAQALYDVAARYRRGGRPCAAAFYAERLRQRYPDSPWSEKAAAFLAPASPFAAPPGAAAIAEPADDAVQDPANAKEETQP